MQIFTHKKLTYSSALLRKLNSRFLFIALLALLMGSLSGSSSSNIRVNQAPAEITLGGLFPLTGELSGSGVERGATFRMAINEINHRSDILPNTVLKYEIRDTGSNPTIGTNAAQQLVEAGVFGVVGAAYSTVSMAAAPVFEAAEIPQISYSSTNPDLSNKTNYPYFLRVVPPDSQQALALADFIYSEMGNSTVATIYANTDYANWTIPVFESEFTALGGTVVTSQRFTPGATDVTTELQAIFDSGVKTILISTLFDDATTVFSQANSVGINAASGFQWVGTDGIGGNGLLGDPVVKSAISGMIGIEISPGFGDLFVHYKDMWECGDPTIFSGAGDRIPNLFATFTYDAVYAFAWAAHNLIDHQGGDPTNGDNLLQILKGLSYQGATGHVGFDAKQDPEGVYSLTYMDGSAFNKFATWSPKAGFDPFGTISLNDGHIIAGSGDPDPALDPVGHIADCSQFEFNEATYVTPVSTPETITETTTHTSTVVSVVTESGPAVTVSETVSTDYTSTTVITEKKAEVPMHIGVFLVPLFFIVLIHRRKQKY